MIPLVACKLIFPQEEMSLMSLLSWELITSCEMSQELSMKCRTILLKWICIGGDKCWQNWQWKTFQRNIWGGCYKVFQTCNNIHGTCWVFAKNDWNTINQMEALDENTILDQEWMNITDLIQKLLGYTWRLAVKTDNKKIQQTKKCKKKKKKKNMRQN